MSERSCWTPAAGCMPSNPINVENERVQALEWELQETREQAVAALPEVIQDSLKRIGTLQDQRADLDRRIAGVDSGQIRENVVERIPVSELEQVKVTLNAKRSTPKPKADDNGFLTWTVELEPRAQTQVNFAWDLSTAPGVQGL